MKRFFTNSIKIITLPFIVFTLLLLSGCETYRIYYGDTKTSINENKRIYRLDLSFQSLTELPAEIESKTKLRRLDLSGNPDLNLSHALTTVCALPKLKVLILNQLQLETLPQSIQKCTSLIQLSLSHNPLINTEQVIETILPLNISFIDFSHNQLTRLPPNLSKLTKLQDLKLSNNTISNSTSYKVLGQLPNLRSLWIDQNQLTYLPNEIGLLSTVNYLYLDNNLLTTLPKSIQLLPNLATLWLGHNCFKEIPPTLSKTNAYMVLLNNNEIDDIGKTFKKEPFKLKGIVLDYNFLSAEQTRESAKIFRDTFIYSDSNQKMRGIKTKCREKTVNDYS